MSVAAGGWEEAAQQCVDEMQENSFKSISTAKKQDQKKFKKFNIILVLLFNLFLVKTC